MDLGDYMQEYFGIRMLSKTCYKANPLLLKGVAER
jgi:hypothetical protein